jgi:threonine dehydrogenase-like Zn-dependent dehydrogenase
MPYTNIKEGGSVAILAGCGPMGLEAIDLALHSDIKPSTVVVTDISEERLNRAEQIFSPADALKDGIKLIFSASTDKDELMALNGGKGYDDVFVYAPVPAVVELGDAILGFDGCLNFFAGPLDKAFSANFNFYNVHYAQHHVAGTSGSTPDDMRDIVKLIGEKRINPAVMVTHVGGIDCAIETTLNLPKLTGGKKLIYTHINLPLTAISDFAELGKTDARFLELARLVDEHNGLWCAEAERYLLGSFNG